MGQKLLSDSGMQQKEAEFRQRWLGWLGPNHAYRAQCINTVFEECTATFEATRFVDFSTNHRVGRKWEVDKRYIFFTVTRSLASMNLKERAYLRIAEFLNSAYDGKQDICWQWRAALIYGDGKGTTTGGARQWLLKDGEDFDTAIRREIERVDQTVDSIQQHVRSLLGGNDLGAETREVLQEFADQVAGGGGGGAWLKSSHLAGSVFARKSNFALYIGSFPDRTKLTYSDDGSIITIAPPRSGKTQCNVLPNLLTWTGPAVVLDITGELYASTAAWRKLNVGPVYKFSPIEPESSNKYNPLTFVNNDPDLIWNDASLLADMMMVPTVKDNPYWDNQAKDVIKAAIASACYRTPPEKRPMSAFLDVLFGGAAWDALIQRLRGATDVPEMTRYDTLLSNMSETERNSVLGVARVSLGAWIGARIARATSGSDWSPGDLRDGSNPTIYMCLRANEVDAYVSLLRVFIGQHIRTLTTGDRPPRDSPPILLMLDELPQLGHMPPVEQALVVGGNFNLRVWMFVQSVGQLKTAYENAEGMIASCAVRIYMNPSGADGMAEKVSEQLGYVESLNDNSRKRLVEAADLAGSAYRDRQIVIGKGEKPVIVNKDFAYNSAALTQRMKTPTQAAMRVVKCPMPHCGAKQRIPAAAIKYKCGKCGAITVG